MREFFNKTPYNKYHIIAFGMLAFVAHPFYWFWWSYILPNIYENPYLRIIGSLSGLIMVIMIINEDKFRKIIPISWIIMVTYNLPFIFTFFLLKNHLCEVWLMAEIIMIFTVLIFIHSLTKALLVLAFGMTIAVISIKLTGDEIFYPSELFISHFVMYFLALFGGSILNKTNVLGIEEIEKQKSEITAERAKIFKYLAGSIAHELRNPINTINLTGTQIKNLLNQSSDFNNKEKISSLTDQISDSISEANNIINIILSDLSENPIDDKDFVFLQPNLIIPKIVQNYSYKNQDEKNCVQLIVSPSNDFTIKAVPERFTFIIYNLLKNALYYLNQYTDLKITIGAEVREIKGVKWNTIYVHDTGPGISPEIISKLFDDFYTSNKKDGTGLGLSFCKRNMKAFGGDIICESQFGNGANCWTKFSLLFPQIQLPTDHKFDNKITLQPTKNPNNSMTNLNTKNISDFSELLANKKILIADDHDLSLKTMQGWLECYGCEVSTALNGEDLVRAYKNNLDQNYKSNFDLIITDFCMPIKNGDEVVREIRELEKQNNVSSCNATPIIVVSGNDDRETINTLQKSHSTKNFVKGDNLENLLEIILDLTTIRQI